MDKLARPDLVPAFQFNERRRAAPAARVGWSCPVCGAGHPPELTTCPHDKPAGLADRLRVAPLTTFRSSNQ